MGKESGGPITIGYHYYLSMHLVVCQGPVDYIREIRSYENVVIWGDKIAPGTAGDFNTPVTTSINKPSLYGGVYKEGGVVGNIITFFGGKGQQPSDIMRARINGQLPKANVPSFTDPNVLNAYMAGEDLTTYSATTTNATIASAATNTELVPAGHMPAFRGVTSVFWDDLRYQTNSSRPKPWNFKVCRIPYRGRTTNGGDATNPTLDVSVIPLNVTNAYNTYGGTDILIKDGNNNLALNSGLITPWGIKIVNNQLMQFDWNGQKVARGDVPVPGTSTTVSKYQMDNGADWEYYIQTTTTNAQGANIQGFVSLGFSQGLCKAISDSPTAPPGTLYPLVNSTIVNSSTNQLDPSSNVTYEEANPAYIILEVLTSKTFGLGYTEAQIDLDSFDNVAYVLFKEKFGVSTLWENSTTIEDFLSVVLTTINGVMYLDPVTGKFVLKLIRANDASVLDLNETNVLEVRNYARTGTSEIVNQISVQWTDAVLNTPRSMTVHNPAIRELQGGAVVAIIRQYPAVTSDSVAAMIAARDLSIYSSPMASIEIVANRKAARLVIGDVVTWSWNDLGIKSMSLRVLSVGYGQLEDGRITLKCVEDIFSAHATAYIMPTGTKWGNPSSIKAMPAPHQRIYNLSYWDLFKLSTLRRTSEYLGTIDLESGVVAHFACPPNDLSGQFESWYFTDSNPTWRRAGVMDFIPYAETATEILLSFTEFSIRNHTWLHRVNLNTLVVCAFEDVIEVMEVTGISPDLTSITVLRGVAGTVPCKFPAGSELWFYSDHLDKVVIDLEFPNQTVMSAKALTITGLNALSDPTAVSIPQETRVVTGSWANPYPVANVRLTVNSQVSFTIQWDHRDAALLQDKLMADKQGTMLGATPGIYYAIRILSPSGQVLYDNPEFVNTSYTHLEESAILALDKIIVAVAAVQGDLYSEWNYTVVNPATGSVYTSESVTQGFIGTLTPVARSISEQIQLQLVGDFTQDATTGEFIFTGDSIRFRIINNAESLFALHSQKDRDTWFNRYCIDIISPERVNPDGSPIILATKYTREDQFTYQLYDNTIDHGGTPASVIEMVVRVEDTARNYSPAAKVIKSTAGVEWVSDTLVFKNTTGLNAPAGRIHRGPIGLFGDADPTTLDPSFDADIPASIRHHYVQTRRPEPITAYPVWQKRDGVWKLSTKTWDFTNYEMVVPIVTPYNPVKNTLYKMNAQKFYEPM